MSQNKPNISVLMGVYNSADTVQESVEAILAYPGDDMELVIVDDGSTDNSGDVVLSLKDPRVRLVRTPNGGVGAAKNRALEEARGSISMFCDADDLYTPGRIAEQSEFLREHPEFDAVVGLTEFVKADGALYHRLSRIAEVPREVTDEVKAGHVKGHLCAHAFRTEPLRALGGFRPYFASAQDLDLIYRFSEKHRIWLLPKPAYQIRFRDGSVTQSRGRDYLRFFVEMGQECRRQRQEHGQDEVEAGNARPHPPRDAGKPFSMQEKICPILRGYAWKELEYGQRQAALKLGADICRRRPLALDSWTKLLKLSAKAALKPPKEADSAPRAKQ